MINNCYNCQYEYEHHHCAAIKCTGMDTKVKNPCDGWEEISQFQKDRNNEIKEFMIDQCQKIEQFMKDVAATPFGYENCKTEVHNVIAEDAVEFFHKLLKKGY
jgi:ATP-dependent phosphoenolpyruvate carboxykinase